MKASGSPWYSLSSQLFDVNHLNCSLNKDVFSIAEITSIFTIPCSNLVKALPYISGLVEAVGLLDRVNKVGYFR